MGRFSRMIHQAGLALVVCGLLLSGCTRESKDSSSVRLSIPTTNKSNKIGSLTQELTVVIVNVSFPGMPHPIFYEWSGHSCPVNVTCAPPSVIALDVPKGPDRLIQVLAVYEDEATGQMTFKYGDMTKTLMGITEDVPITVTQIGSAGMQGHISGRYMDASAGGGPTGMVVGKFDPGGGKPMMSVIRSFMFAGWFTNLMAMDGTAKFHYYLNGDQPLFTDINLSSPVIAGSTNVVRINVPQRDRQNWNGGVSVWETEAASKMIFGYFGPNAGSNKACYDQRTNIDIPEVRIPTTSTTMKWGGASPAANQVGVEAGGVAYDPSTANSEPCEITATEFSGHMDFKYTQLRNGHDSVTGFRGAFKGTMNNGNLDYASKSHDPGAQTLTIGVNYLPGVTTGPARIQGITAYRRTVAGGGGSHDDLYGGGFDGIDCNRLPYIGFVQAGPDYAIAADATSDSIVLNGFPTLSNTQLVLCPYLQAGAAGRFYPPAGVEVWLDSSAPMTNSISLKLIGSDLSNSYLDGAPFAATVPPMHKNSFRNTFHNFAVQAGSSQLQASDILSAEASIDNGSTWIPIMVADQTYGGSRSMTILPITSSTALGTLQDDLYNLIPATGDTNLKIKITVSAATKTAKNLSSEVFESPVITLLGSGGVCASQGTLELYDVGAASVITPSALINSFSGGGSSDTTKAIKLRWSSCPQAFATLDQIYFSGLTATPGGCFDKQDIDFDPSDPFLIHFSPKDRMGVDCTLSGGLAHIELWTPSNAGADKVDIAFSSATITHSTTPYKLGFLVQANATMTSVAEKFMYSLAMFGGSVTFKTGAINLNMDGKVTNPSTPGVASATNDWGFGALAPSFSAPAPTDDNVFSVGTVTTPPANNPVVNISSTDGAVTGGLPTLVTGSNFKVFAATDRTVDGGSPMMVIDDGTSLKLAFIPSNSGNFVGKQLKIMPMPTDYTFPPNPNYVRIIAFDNNGPMIWVAARYGTTSKYAYGRMNGNGDSMTMDWAPSASFASEAVYGAELEFPGGSPRIIVGVNGASPGIVSTPVPTWSGSWSAGTAKSNTNMASTVVTTGLSLVRCQNEIWSAGRDGANEWIAQRVSNFLSPTMGPSVADATLISDATKAVCLGMDNGSGFPARVFVAYNETNFTNYMFAYRPSSGSYCGAGGGDAFMSNPGSITGLTGTNGIMGLLPIVNSSGQGFLVAYAGGGYPTKLSFVPMNCSSSTVTAGGPSMFGAMGMPSAQILGMSPLLNGYPSPSTSVQNVNDISVFGYSSQFYQLTGR